MLQIQLVKRHGDILLPWLKIIRAQRRGLPEIWTKCACGQAFCAKGEFKF